MGARGQGGKNEIKGFIMKKGHYGVFPHWCRICGHKWMGRLQMPKVCPACQTNNWLGVNPRINSKYGVHLLAVGQESILPFATGANADRRIRAIVAWGKRHGREFFLGSNFYIKRIR